MNSAFNRAKQLLSVVPELVHPQSNTAISLSMDASDSHIGAVLQILVSAGFLLKEALWRWEEVLCLWQRTPGSIFICLSLQIHSFIHSLRLLVLFHLVMVSCIFSPWLIELWDGRRPFLCPPSQLSLVLVLSFLPGFQDSEFLQLSHLIEVRSSRLQSGLEFVLS